MISNKTSTIPVLPNHNMNNLPEKVVPAQDLQLCEICARGFTPDRIRVHEQICRKSSEDSRHPFNISQQRIRSLKTENFSEIGVQESIYNKVHENRPKLFTNWQLKHEEVITKIRDAKKLMQENSPSNPNDLSAPLTTEVNSYVRCPHCLKQFNQPSAERHINMCASMINRTRKSKTDLACSRNPKASESSVASK